MPGNLCVICDFWEEKFAAFLKHSEEFEICVELVYICCRF